MKTTLALPFALLGAMTAAGCSTTSRYVTAEHWPTGDSFYVAYTEYTATNYLVARSGSSSARVMLCRASESNDVVCRPQPAVDRLLNPHEDHPEPPPPPVQATPVALDDDEVEDAEPNV